MPIFRLMKSLRKNGVLGMNARNADYIMPYNPRRFYPRADSKVISKRLAQAAGIPVPELYAIVSSVGGFSKVREQLLAFDEFVVKPEHGAGGEGVLVLSRSENGDLLNSRGEVVPLEKLRMHIANIVYGLYSLGGQPDRAVIEYKVEFAPVFAEVTYQGVPDIRIVVFQGVPVIAMMRLPTRRSSGRANLHQGAVGVGIDLATGITRGGVLGSSPVDKHPDTGAAIVGLTIPHWDKILEIAGKSSELFELGYLGIDIVLDKVHGPLVLEVNVRPGLAVQLANRTGLKHRLSLVKSHIDTLSSVEEKLRFAKERVSVVGATA